MRRLLRILILAGLAGLIATLSFSGWTWWTSGRFEVATDNAYLRTDITSLAPKVAGYVVDVQVGDNQMVHTGDILFHIDDRDYKARLAQADANIAAAEATLANLDAERNLQQAAILQAAAQLDAALSRLTLARQNFERSGSLVRTRTASPAQLEQAEAAKDQANAAVDAAKAALEATKKKLDVLAAQKLAASAALKQARATRDLAQLDLDNTVVRAPLDGIVGNRQVRLGRFVTPGHRYSTLFRSMTSGSSPISRKSNSSESRPVN
ncbi:HlyD family secretion protein [Hoeflea algicola]|uniref:HlyD family secretion protein n=1 Tax=Hoeflea algicola TaxID=2983763 RepID=UPI003CE5C5DE